MTTTQSQDLQVCQHVIDTYGGNIREAIKLTQQKRKEHGFWMCVDPKAEMPIVEGTHENVDGKAIYEGFKCPEEKAYGFFHTHPGIDIVKSFDDVIDSMKLAFANIISTPSHHDIAAGRQLGTVLSCVAGANVKYPNFMTCIENHDEATELASKKLSFTAMMLSSLPGLNLDANAIEKAEQRVLKSGNGCKIKVG